MGNILLNILVVAIILGLAISFSWNDEKERLRKKGRKMVNGVYISITIITLLSFNLYFHLSNFSIESLIVVPATLFVLILVISAGLGSIIFSGSVKDEATEAEEPEE